MLLQCLKKETGIWVPNSDCIISRTWHDMIAIWFHIFYTRHFMVMALKSLDTFKFLFFVYFPKFNCHVSCATSHWLAIRIETDIVYHSCMFSESLFNLTCFIVPDLYWSIFTWGSNLIVYWVEYASCNSCSMSYHFQFLWFPWNSITCVLNIFIFTCNCTWLSTNWSIFFELFFHVLHINLILLIYFLKLFAISLKLHNLLFKSGNWCPLSFQNVFEEWLWLCGSFQIFVIVYSCL